MIRRYLMDTGIAQDFQDDRGKVRDRAIAIRKTGHRIGICVPVLGELWAGEGFSGCDLDWRCIRRRDFLPQLEQAEVTSWKCPCGCASVNFRVKGYPPAPPGVHILGDFVFGGDDNLCGIFIYESAGILSGLEVCGYATDAPRLLPAPESLRSISGPHSA